MPRPDHYPADIMDKCQAFSDALNAYLLLAPDFERAWSQEWERRYSPSQTRIPAGQPGGGRWTDGNETALIPVAVNREPKPEAAATRRGVSTMPGEFHESFGKPQDGLFGPPHPMRPDEPRIRPKDYDEFKKVMGAAKEGYQYHHIVEQRELTRSPELDPKDEGSLNGNENIIEIPRKLHECINGKMQKKDEETGKSPREENEGKTIKEKFEKAIKIIEECLDQELRKKKPQEQPSPAPEIEADRVPNPTPTPAPTSDPEESNTPTPRIVTPPTRSPLGGRGATGFAPLGAKPGLSDPFSGRMRPLPIL